MSNNPRTRTITEAEVKENLKGNPWHIRQCSMCFHPVTYHFRPDRVYLDTNCDCASYFTEPEEISYEEFMETFNRQPTEEGFNSLWESFVKSQGENHGK